MRGVAAVEQDRELVAAEPCDDVAVPDGGEQSGGDHPEQLVADLMAEQVVDGLEVVEVETEERDLLAGVRCQLVDR